MAAPRKSHENTIENISTLQIDRSSSPKKTKEVEPVEADKAESRTQNGDGEMQRPKLRRVTPRRPECTAALTDASCQTGINEKKRLEEHPSSTHKENGEMERPKLRRVISRPSLDKSPLHTSSDNLQVPVMNETTALETIHRLTGQSRIFQSFRCIFESTNRRESCTSELQLLGAGTFGQVFSCEESNTVYKLIPIGNADTDDADQAHCRMTFSQVLSEVTASYQLSLLAESHCSPVSVGDNSNNDSSCLSRHVSKDDNGISESNDTQNSTRNFAQLKAIYLLEGRVSSNIRQAWSDFYKERDASRLAFYDDFMEDQKWVVIQSQLCGPSVHQVMPPCIQARQSIFIQVALAVAVAEETLEFEHRDLHLGNILLDPLQDGTWHSCCNNLPPPVMLQGKEIQPIGGPTVKIIDFSLSRITHGGSPYAFDLSNYSSLFLHNSASQAYVYKEMLKTTRGNWESFCPRNNIHWLNYLARQLLRGDNIRPEERQGKLFVEPCGQHSCLRRLQQVRNEIRVLLGLSSSAMQFIQMALSEASYLFIQ